jgi:hypothetical protein
MIHVFLLFVFIGSQGDKQLVSNDMYFKSLDDCTWYAQTLHKQGSQITAYCLPAIVDKDTKVY